jgi:NADPH:quinone reductase-like Zn-dependent oxidoreductase
MFAIKLARAAGYKTIVSSSSDKKLRDIMERFPGPVPIQTVNYSSNPDWHEEVLRLTDGIGVDLVLENGGPQTLVKSLRCTRRGGIVSQVGYLSNRAGWSEESELIPTLIDRRIVLR